MCRLRAFLLGDADSWFVDRYLPKLISGKLDIEDLDIDASGLVCELVVRSLGHRAV